MERSNHLIVENLREYNLNKKIKEQVKIINSLLSQNETDLKVHLKKALNNGLITKNELDFLHIKMELGRMCLDLEEVLEDVYVSILFYDKQHNNIYHGAGPSISVDYFDLFNDINEQGILDEYCSSCGRALYTYNVIQTDIKTSPLWRDLRDIVLERGFKSCTSIPFFTPMGQIAGTFGLYSSKSNHVLTQDEVEMVQEKVAMFSLEIQTISDRIDEYTEVGNAKLTI